MATNPIHPSSNIDEEVLYARALQTLALANRPEVSWKSRSLALLSIIYHVMMISIVGFIIGMAIDRRDPVIFHNRELVNRSIQPGQQIQIRAIRDRTRMCEWTRQYVVWDGANRRIEYDPKSSEAGGEIEDNVDDVNGPILPIDAAAGEGRILTIFAFDCNVLQKATGWSIKIIPPMLKFQIMPKVQNPSQPVP